MARDSLNVFLNVPFDEDYAPLLDAAIFAVTACGYRVRCALEEDDSGDIRLDKLARMVRESPSSIHDLSRVELGENDLPRFNMPFELGLAVGAKRFGGEDHKKDAIKIMVAERYDFPASLSDLAGNDPSAHNSDPNMVIGIIRNFLHRTPTGKILIGPAKLIEVFREFKRELPNIARDIDFQPDELGGLKSYREYLVCVREFLTQSA